MLQSILRAALCVFAIVWGPWARKCQLNFYFPSKLCCTVDGCSAARNLLHRMKAEEAKGCCIYTVVFINSVSLFIQKTTNSSLWKWFTTSVNIDRREGVGKNGGLFVACVLKPCDFCVGKHFWIVFGTRNERFEFYLPALGGDARNRSGVGRVNSKKSNLQDQTTTLRSGVVFVFG